jgi:thiamine pyrophosphate-dependent acetolactate synthase large subunit-like protein
MTVAETVGRTVAELGIDTVFGVVGSGNFAVTNALVKGGARFVPARHEMGATVMADAWARVSGRVGCVSVHQGPGLTNAMTGVAEAAKSRTPLLVLAGDTAAGAVRSNFRIDQAALVAAVGAVPERVHSPSSAQSDSARAYRTALLDRRTVVLNLPLDVQSSEAPGEPAPTATFPVAPRPAGESVEAVAGVLRRAERPMFIAGRGAVLSDAGEAIERLADAVGALLATSAQAHGLFAGNPWSVGISGGFSSPVAAALIASADAVVAFGASLTMWTTRHGKLINTAATVVQVDLDVDALGASHPVDVPVVGDVAATARDLLAAMPGERRSGWRTEELRDRIAAGSWRQTPYEDEGDGDRIDPRTLSIALDELLPGERLVALDSGAFMGWPAMYWGVSDQKGFVFTQAFQSIGLGLATAIGAAVARPDRLVVAALGDGGFLMGAAELETVARLGLSMLLVVYNDAAYGAEVHHFAGSAAPLDTVRFPDADLAAIAGGYGLAGVTVRRPEDLDAVRDWLGGPRDRAMLVDAKIVPTVAMDWLEEAFRGH